MVDDSCSSVSYISGDANANTQLEVNETWTYICTMTLTATHTNRVVATGLANGITATDTASATVVVGATFPKFPNTGFGGRRESVWSAVIPAGLIVALCILSCLKKRPQSNFKK
jgi:hypothetical protein